METFEPQYGNVVTQAWLESQPGYIGPGSEAYRQEQLELYGDLTPAQILMHQGVYPVVPVTEDAEAAIVEQALWMDPLSLYETDDYSPLAEYKATAAVFAAASGLTEVSAQLVLGKLAGKEVEALVSQWLLAVTGVAVEASVFNLVVPQVLVYLGNRFLAQVALPFGLELRLAVRQSRKGEFRSAIRLRNVL